MIADTAEDESKKSASEVGREMAVHQSQRLKKTGSVSVCFPSREWTASRMIKCFSRVFKKKKTQKKTSTELASKKQKTRKNGKLNWHRKIN